MPFHKKLTAKFLRRDEILRLRSDVRSLKRMQGNIEVKHIDLEAALTGSTSMQIHGQLFTIAQGDNEGQRDGQEIVIRRMHFRLILTLPTTVTVASASDVVRIIIFKDKQTNGAVPNAADLLTTNASAINLHYNLDHKNRFIILMDRVFAMNSPAGAGSSSQFAPVRRYVEFNRKMNVKITYNNSVTTGAVASVESNNIYIAHVSLLGNVDIGLSVRTSYTD